MARIAKPLTDTEIRQAKPRDKEYSLADGKNLYLRVRPSGRKYWILNYYRPGTRKRANVGLGTYPEVTLAVARKKADELSAVLAEGVDPKEYREEQERAQAEKHSNTFEHIARKWLELKKGRVSPAYYDKISCTSKHLYIEYIRAPGKQVTSRPRIHADSHVKNIERTAMTNLTSL